jgi:hypothetical protein
VNSITEVEYIAAADTTKGALEWTSLLQNFMWFQVRLDKWRYIVEV